MKDNARAYWPKWCKENLGIVRRAILAGPIPAIYADFADDYAADILRFLDSERRRFRAEVRKWERVDKFKRANIYKHYADSIELVLSKLKTQKERA